MLDYYLALFISKYRTPHQLIDHLPDHKTMNWLKNKLLLFFNRLNRWRMQMVNKKLLREIIEAESATSDFSVLLGDNSTGEHPNTLANDLALKATYGEMKIYAQEAKAIRKNYKKLFEPHELQGILLELNSKLVSLYVRQREISQRLKAEKKKDDNFLELFSGIVTRRSRNSSSGKLRLEFPNGDTVSKSLSNLDSLLEKNGLLKIYHSRVEKEEKAIQLKKKDLKHKITLAENLINQAKLSRAKELLKEIKNIAQINNWIEFYPKIDNLELKSNYKEIEILEKEKERQLDRILRELLEDTGVTEFEERKVDIEIVVDNDKENVLDSFGITQLYHMTSLDNLENILLHGILSHNSAHAQGLVHNDISMNEVNQRRANKRPIHNVSLHDYVPLYFNPKNPMLFKRKDIQDKLVILGVNRSLIYHPLSIFSDGNAASNDTMFFNDVSMLSKLNWTCIKREFWNDFIDGKRIKCAETLVRSSIPANYIVRIYCINIEVKNQVDSLLGSNSRIKAEVKSALFFNSGHSYDNIYFN